MSANEREANQIYGRRRRHLENFLRSHQSGLYSRDLAIWADEQELCTRTAKEYWHRAEMKGLVEIIGDHWKWITAAVTETETDKESTKEYTRKNKASTEEPPGLDFKSPTPFTDYVKRKKLEELRQKLRRPE